MFDDAKSVFRRILRLGFLLVLVVGVLGSVIGYLVAGQAGLYAALCGSGAAFAFTAVTVVSVWFGSDKGLGVFLGLVLGGWLIKVVLFLVLFSLLNQADWLTREARPVVFFTVVASVLLGLALDTWIVSKAKISPGVKLP
ncbi:MAG: hypothetical protein EBT82_02075 [Micrococcales bacterium]|nr:hypothetical protein [Micrococcales bacterium]NBR60417.1 hypothetical protein [Actinomycetota bacterium]NBR54755.1 hypothetical protein [Micrococcales bacterium]NBT46416.1 hypothetical protein [Actinomycetota bacterium]NBY44162.1 hypothetical protein [Micrococcales bacterium]